MLLRAVAAILGLICAAAVAYVLTALETFPGSSGNTIPWTAIPAELLLLDIIVITTIGIGTYLLIVHAGSQGRPRPDDQT